MKNCAYEDVHCTNPECNEVMPRRTLQYHLVSKCRWRVVSCHFCAEMYTYKDSKVRFELSILGPRLFSLFNMAACFSFLICSQGCSILLDDAENWKKKNVISNGSDRIETWQEAHQRNSSLLYSVISIWPLTIAQFWIKTFLWKVIFKEINENKKHFSESGF